MAIIPDFFLNAVVALGIDGGDGKSTGLERALSLDEKKLTIQTFLHITSSPISMLLSNKNMSTFVSIRLEGSLLRIIELAYMTAWACLCSLRIRMIKQI